MRQTRSLNLIIFALLAVGMLFGSDLLDIRAHDDDPKILDRQPPYEGPSFRSGGPGAAPLGVGFASNGVQLLSWLTLAEFGSPSSGNDCWGYTAPSGREYALFGHSDGTGFVEVTDPTNPVVVANIAGPNSLWRDIKTYLDHAYAVTEGGGGIQVFDLSAIDSGTVTLVGSVASGDTHNVAIDTDSGFLYRCGGAPNGIAIYSLANPSNPTQVGSWPDRYVHDLQVITYSSGPYAGRQIAFCASGLNGGGTDTGLTVLDVTNKSSITVRSQLNYPAGAYSHQLWVDANRQYLYHGDELDESNNGLTTTSRIFDISDIDNVSYVTSFSNGNPAIDHNMYIHDGLLFQANYRSGLRVFDLTNPLAPTEVAFFDTYPDNDSASFNGLWSNYPFFPSGTVIGSDLERGLFVWRLGGPAIALSLPDGEPPMVDPGGESVSVRVEEIDGSLVAGTAKLTYDDGSGPVTVDLIPASGDLFDAPFGATTCGSTVSWYVTALGDDGIQRYLPDGAPSETFGTTSATALVTAFDDDVETNTGWTLGAPGDDATTGVWERVNPNGTAAQPEDDHTAVGTICFVTGQGSVGGSVGENDVDGGQTTLSTPTLDLSALTDPTISYWRWFSNDQGSSANTDIFTIDISDDGGSSWTNVEVVGPTGAETGGGWFFHQFRVLDFVSATAQVRMRFIAADENQGSIVEAAIDDFLVSDVQCSLTDCNNNGIDDAEDIASGTSLDCNSNGIPDECDIADATSLDCNANGIPDECDIASGFSQDCNANGIPDDCDLASGASLDCNGNSIPDECDISAGTSLDCNGNSIPDECDLASGFSQDCNTNGIPDECDLASGFSQDCNTNGIPDECDIASGFSEDCNTNGIPDDCDLASGFSQDCNTNGIPDECDIAGGFSEDCNGNGIPDDCDFASGFSEDCNGNGLPDECDISAGNSQDVGGNGIPDECESAILACGQGQINVACGATSDVLRVNGTAGGAGRAMLVTQSTPLTFSIEEAPAMRGDGQPSSAILYMWFALPGGGDVVDLPKQLGLMCFGPKLVETRPADFIWNSVGSPNKAGQHNAPTDPPSIPDGATLDFYDLPAGWGSAIEVTVQGLIPDSCTQGRKPFSVTNGFVLRVQ